MPKTLPNIREAALLTILTTGEKYGRELREHYQKRTKSELPLGSLYTTLDRMEDQGFVTSRTGDPNPERGGNRRKFYKITAPGLRALNSMRDAAMMFGKAVASE